MINSVRKNRLYLYQQIWDDYEDSEDEYNARLHNNGDWFEDLTHIREYIGEYNGSKNVENFIIDLNIGDRPVNFYKRIIEYAEEKGIIINDHIISQFPDKGPYRVRD